MNRRYLTLLLVPVVLLAMGTVGYRVVEDWSWFGACPTADGHAASKPRPVRWAQRCGIVVSLSR